MDTGNGTVLASVKFLQKLSRTRVKSCIVSCFGTILFQTEKLQNEDEIKIQLPSKILTNSSPQGADKGKKWTSSKFSGFPILSNIYPIFHNVFPILQNISLIFTMFPRFFTTFPRFFTKQNCSRFASANVAIVWIRAVDILPKKNFFFNGDITFLQIWI